MCPKLGNNKAIPRQSTGMGMGISLDQSEPRGALWSLTPDDFYEAFSVSGRFESASTQPPPLYFLRTLTMDHSEGADQHRWLNATVELSNLGESFSEPL